MGLALRLPTQLENHVSDHRVHCLVITNLQRSYIHDAYRMQLLA